MICRYMCAISTGVYLFSLTVIVPGITKAENPSVKNLRKTPVSKTFGKPQCQKPFKMCSWIVSIYCFTSGTSRDSLDTNLVVSHWSGKESWHCHVLMHVQSQNIYLHRHLSLSSMCRLRFDRRKVHCFSLRYCQQLLSKLLNYSFFQNIFGLRI